MGATQYLTQPTTPAGVVMPDPNEFDLERETSLAVLRGHAPVTATDVSGLYAELLAWIEYRFEVTGGAIRMADVNRRFGVTVRRLSLTCAQVTEAMIRTDLILTFEYKRNALLVPRAEYMKQRDRRPDDVEYAAKFHEGVLKRAFGEL